MEAFESPGPGARRFGVLVLEGEELPKNEDSTNNAFLRFLSLASTDVGTLKSITNCLSLKHSIIEINDESIMEITNKSLKIDADKIMNDIKKRQIPRFRDDPPSASTQNALQELKRYFEELSR